MMKHIYTKLTFLLFLMLGSTSLFGSTYYSKLTGTASPTGAGKVYINDAEGNNTQDKYENQSHTYTIKATPNDGYYFSKWSGSSVSLNSTTNNPTTCTINATSTDSRNRTSGSVTATFKAVTVSSVNSNTASSSSPLKVVSPSTAYYATVKFTVANADATADFSYSVSGTGWAFDSWSYSSNTIEIKVKYSATSSVSKGNHNGTVKLTSKGSSSSSKSATVYAKVDFTPTLTYDNGTCDISVSDADKTTLDVSTLKTAYTGSDGQTGDGAITYALKNASSNASVTSAGIFYAKALDTYTIVASADKGRYYAKTAEFTVTVGKRTPTVEWTEYEHIYSGNALNNVTTIKYNGNTVSGVGITLKSLNPDVMTVEGNNLHAQILATQQDATIQATTEETTYYKSVTPTHTYTVEAKQTPIFKLNGKTLVAQDTTIYLKIGETATMTFDKIDENDNQFTYPTTAGAATYTHNTGVISAVYYGNREMVFEQKGTTTIFGQKHTIKVFVEKHDVTLATTTSFNNKTWLVDNIFDGDVYTVTPTPANSQPAQNAVTVTSSDENVLKLVDGKWRAMGEGDATLTIAQQANNFWTGDTITTANIHVSKHTPTITWSSELNSQRPWGAIINNPVSSTNTDVPFTLVSSDTTVADYVNGKIEVYNKKGEVTFTLTQEGNNKWNAVSNDTKTFSVYKPNNHVEFTLTDANKSYIHHSASSNAEWNSSGYYRLCDGGTHITDNKIPTDYAIIRFTGIPKTLTFDKSLEKYKFGFIQELPGTHICQVFESPDGTNWEEVWSHNERVENTNNQSANLSPSTQYVKFQYYGTVYCRYKNIKITERSEIKAPTTFDFPSGGIGDNPTVLTIPVEWYNVKTCTVTISGTDAKYFKLGEHSDTIDSHIDKYNTSNIEVSYLHEEIKNKHTATLHIQSEDGKTADVVLNGETTKAVQEIIWNEDLLSEGRILVANGETYSDVATASSEQPVQLTSGDLTKLTVLEDGSIKGLAEGSVQLYAYQAGDNKWAEARETIYVDITNKTVQHIIWDDTLSNIQRENGKTVTKPLTAHSDIEGVTLPITYELDNDAKAFASISNGVLTITGWGTGKITAKQKGNNTYVAVSATRTLMSYNPNPSCDPNTVLTKSSITVKVTSSVTNQEFDLSGEPEMLSFTARIGSGSLTVAQYYNGTWHNLDTYTGSSGDGNHQYKLNRNATKISFQSTIVVALPIDHKITNLTVTQAKYLELDNKNNLDFSTVQLGQTVKRSFTVNYSDISGVMEVALQNPSNQFELQTLTLGTGCGSTKKADVVKINCTGKNKGKEDNAIVIRNKKESLIVPISATVTGLTQQIHWNLGDREEIETTDNITLSATADSEMYVSFSSSDNDIAEVKNVNGQYVLDIKKGNEEVTITATQAGNDSWEPATKSCVFAISKVTPTISTDPTAEEVILPKTLEGCAIHNDFEASVSGSFAWKTSSTSIARNNSGYTAVFTPDNTDWYNTVERTIVVPVAKTPQQINWDVDNTEIFCNAEITFHATATEGNTSVYFTSSDDQIAYVDDDQVLRISQGGKVKLTAKTDGNDSYAPAEKEYTFTILRVSPEIVTYPVADTMRIGGLLSDATIRGGLVKLGNAVVDGSFSWVDGNTTAMNVAGTFAKEILFTPTEAGWYEPITGENLNVVVKKYAPIITSMNLTASDITYGTILSGVTGLTGTVVATDTVKKPNVIVEGTYAWASKDEFYDVNTETATVEFIPENDDWYDNLTFEVPLHVLPGHTTYSATATLDYGQTLADAIFTNTTKGLNNEDVAGSVQWAASVDLTSIPSAGTHTYAITFTPEEGSNYAGGEGTCTLVVEEVNLIEGDDISNTEERVVINTNITITDDVTVGGMTINPNFTVTIADGASLTIGNENSLYRANYGNIIVEAGGQLNLNEGQVALNDFTLHASAGGYLDDEDNTLIAGKSGQVSNEQQLTVQGKAYFVLDLDPSGAVSYGWYAFTVPFPVDELHGVSRWENEEWKTLTNETHYAIMDYHEELRAEGKNGWKKYTKTLQPGVGYLMTTNSTVNRYRFEKTENGSFNHALTQSLQVTAGADEDKGWNNIGNGTMTYVSVTNAPVGNKVLMYDHLSNGYDLVNASACEFVVGASYFVQASENGSILNMESTINDETHASLRAPKRLEDVQKLAATISISRANNTSIADQLFITADEDAINSYTIGKDLAKMGNITTSKRARIWTTMKSGALCVVDAPLQGNRTIVPLQLFMPKPGVHTISAEDVQAESVYLMRNGVVIWNLLMSDYTADFTTGTNSEYSIMLVKQGENTATGIDGIDNNSNNRGIDFVEKLIIDDQLFILRDGILYDAQGRMVTTK